MHQYDKDPVRQNESEPEIPASELHKIRNTWDAQNWLRKQVELDDSKRLTTNPNVNEVDQGLPLKRNSVVSYPGDTHQHSEKRRRGPLDQVSFVPVQAHDEYRAAAANLVVPEARHP